LLTYAIIFVVGLLGNFGVLIKVIRHQSHRSPQNFFLLNLIVTDILLCLAAIPTTPLYGLTRNWNYGIIVCRSVNFINSLAVFVSSWCLASIALDKYLHIIKPTRATMGYKSAALITLMIWSACSLINVPFVMSYQIIDGASMNFSTPLCETFCEEVNWGIIFPRRLYGAAVVILQFVVPLIIISFCYARILRKVSNDMIIKNEKYSDCLTAEQRLCAVSRKNRVYYILISMVVTFVASWTPLTLVNAAKDFQFDGDFLNSQPYFIPICAHVFAMTSIIINPLLFFWLTRRAQKTKLSRISSFGFNSIMSRVSFLCRYTSIRNFEKPFR
uniref:G_PROTEIN_RECEP_F1_2 domain-containing protein n=1 Tax=Syphacia muris TaxID=451379 RepID=A0A0N5AXP5_9BILA